MVVLDMSLLDPQQRAYYSTGQLAGIGLLRLVQALFAPILWGLCQLGLLAYVILHYTQTWGTGWYTSSSLFPEDMTRARLN